MKTICNYKNDEEYINHQLNKTTNPRIIGIHKLGWEKYIDKLRNQVSIIDFKPNSKILCIGCRYGEEVEMFNRLGHKDVTGIDLTEFPPYTIKMDMHNLDFKNNIFDVVYTNSLDHSNDIETALSEMVRVVNCGGLIVLCIVLDNYGNYETVVFNSENDIINIIDRLDITYEVVVKRTPSGQGNSKTIIVKVIDK